ncbi:DUF998 domain-containing protein [Lentzea sp.]|uniref:DUF998 domain-containing protein n=1 Tax=Lentzea sp. TaxID=56099 RepID=UPI002ED0C19B
MTDTELEPAVRRTAAPKRRAGTTLMASSIVYLTAELIAAAAWSDPPYSYTHHFISNLGVHGPTTAFGQFMYSPLWWVMNTGFFLFGLVSLTAVLQLGALPGRRRAPLVITAVVLAAGGVLLAFFPGSGDTTDGATDLHGIGAFMAFAGGNVLVVLLGRRREALGLSRRLGRGLVAAGVLGFVSLAGYMTVLSIGAGVLIGLVERGVVYPFLIGFLVVGAALRRGV